jgi:hypothetical protein
MPAYFRFGIGPFRFSQRLGRTQAQKRAYAKRVRGREQARAYDRQSFVVRGIARGGPDGWLSVLVPRGQPYAGDWMVSTRQVFDEGQWVEFRFKGRYARNTGQGWYRVNEAEVEPIATPPEWIAEQEWDGR